MDADREVVNALAKHVHSLHVSWRPDLFEAAEKLYSAERFQNAVKERQLYVAKVNVITVGYVLLAIRDQEWPGLIRRKVMLVDEICMDEGCRNQGVGTGIMEDVHALAKACGCTDLQLDVYPQNESAVAFYQKCGFTIRSIDMQKKYRISPPAEPGAKHFD